MTGHDELDDKPWSQEVSAGIENRRDARLGRRRVLQESRRPTSKSTSSIPDTTDFYNACVPLYGRIGDGVTPSQCGIGETVYTPGSPPNYVDGIPLVKDQAYIGDFETNFKDLAVFGELTGHLTSDWSVTGGTRLFKQTVTQSQQTGLLFDGSGIRSPTNR